MNKIIIILFLSILFVSGCVNCPNCNLNEKMMEVICDREFGGEPYLYESGWSETCGFSVFIGTCVDKFGKVLDSKGYSLVEGYAWSFDTINTFMWFKYKVGEDGITAEESLIRWRKWEDNVCKMFREKGEKMKKYIAKFKVYNGEATYSIPVVTEAKTKEEAEKRFKEYETENNTDIWKLLDFDEVKTFEDLWDWL